MPNLLQKASIVLTPTAYDNGKVLCAKPVDGSGDFDFSRNSAATRVNAQGLVEDVQILSSNLVQNGSFSEQGAEEVTNGNFSQQGSQLITNGDFATDSDWTKGTGWSISGGSANCDGSQSGNADLIQGISTIAGKQYKISYTISNYSDGNIKVRLSSGNTTSTQSSNGTFTEIITAAISGGFRLRGNDTFIGSIDNVSVVEVGQDWVFSSGATLTDLGAKITHTPTAGQISQQFIVIGKQYKFTYEITESVVGGLKLNSAINTSMVTSVGIHTKYFEADATGFTIARTSAINNDVTITNISVKEVGQNWTLGTGWSIGDHKAIALNAAFGSQLIDSTTLTASKKYSISFNISNYVKGSVRIGVGNAFSSDVSSNGDYTFILTAVNTNAFKVQARSGGSGTSLSITNISVIEITNDTNLPRISYDGFSYQDALGSEQVTNGDFSNGVTDWSAGGGGTISVANNQLTIEADNDFNFYARQTVSGFIVGKQYKLTIDVAGGTTSKINVGVFGEGILINDQPIVIGKQSVIFTLTNGADGTRFLDINNRNDDGVNDTLIINSVSIKEYKGQEVVPDSGCGSWLWEPQSTNLIPYSEDFSNSAWGKTSISVLSNVIASPSGEINASKIVESNTSGFHFISDFTATLSGANTFSFYSKAAERTQVSAFFSQSGNVGALFDLTAETATASGTGNTASIESVGNGWYRCVVSNNGSSQISNQVRIGTNNGALGGYQGDGTSGIFIWGAQVEQQTYPTSYIPTDGTSVTRNQDVCTNGGSLASINSTEGVLYAEIAALDNDGTIRFLGLNDGSSNNRVVLLYHNSNNNIRAIISSGGTKFVDVNSSVTSSLDFHKVAIKYKANDFAFWIDGVEVATDTSLNAPIGLNSLDFLLSGANNFFGKTKAVAVFPFLTDTELQELTTI